MCYALRPGGLWEPCAQGEIGDPEACHPLFVRVLPPQCDARRLGLVKSRCPSRMEGPRAVPGPRPAGLPPPKQPEVPTGKTHSTLCPAPPSPSRTFEFPSHVVWSPESQCHVPVHSAQGVAALGRQHRAIKSGLEIEQRDRQRERVCLCVCLCLCVCVCVCVEVQNAPQSVWQSRARMRTSDMHERRNERLRLASTFCVVVERPVRCVSRGWGGLTGSLLPPSVCASLCMCACRLPPGRCCRRGHAVMKGRCCMCCM
mmetsp:Transcript_108595/g.184026  ORF Transcript_108595/g.184026 Transcript_108595/m.184026 type:complete len:257 (-) Transcript_108595:377-1147(-)